MKKYKAVVTFGYDRDDRMTWTFEAPNMDAAVKTARYCNPYEGMGYWRIHRVKPLEPQEQ
tara:strand:+ start:1461 stop:1640 length:180 start_codon:yes stop_codon:yes gene_type:complete